VAIGPPGLLILFPLFILIPGICIWAAVDASSQPEWAFEAAGTTKTLWIILPIVGIFVCFVGIVAALMWFTVFRTRVVAAARRGPGFAPPPPPPP
jgi:hypothetical protein